MRDQARACLLLVALLILTTPGAAVSSGDCVNLPLGWTEEVCPVTLREAVERGDDGAARSMLEKRPSLVPHTIWRMMRLAMEEDLALRQTEARSLWDQLVKIAGIYGDVSGDDFLVRYAERCRALGSDQKRLWLEAAEAFKRAEAMLQEGKIDLFKQEVHGTIPLWRGLEDPCGEARAHHILEGYYRSRAEGRAVHTECARKAADLYREAGFDKEYAIMLTWVAWFQEPRRALETLGEAREVFEDLRDDWDLSHVLSDMAWAYSNAGRHAEAFESAEEARRFAVRCGDRYRESLALRDVGALHMHMDAYAQAERYFLEALAIQEEIGTDQADILGNLAPVYQLQGLHLKALRYATRFLDLERGNKRAERHAFRQMGYAYSSLREWDLAAAAWERARAIEEGWGEDAVEALLGLADVEIQRGNGEEARALLYEATRMMEKHPSNWLQRRAALKYEALGDNAGARGSYLSILRRAIAEGDDVDVLESHVGLGDLALKEKDLVTARHHYSEVRRLLSGMSDYHLRPGVLFCIGRFQEAVGDQRGALESYRAALGDSLLDEYLLGAHGGHWVREYCEKPIRLLVELSGTSDERECLIDEAFRIVQRIQAVHLRRLLDSPQADALDEALAGLKARESAVLEELSVVRRGLAEESDPERRHDLSTQIESLEDEHDIIRTRMLRHRHLRPHAAQGRQASLDEIRRGLEEGTAIIQYFLGDDHAFVWTISRGGVGVLELAPPGEIEEAVRFYLEAISMREPAATYETVAARLTSSILTPLLSRLNGVKTLLVIPDGVLHLLPFEALMRGTAGASSLPFSVAYLPAADLLLPAVHADRPGRGKGPRRMLLVADPWLGTKRRQGRPAPQEEWEPGVWTERGYYERGGFDVGPLPHARREARGIARTLAWHSGICLLKGKSATEEAIKSQDLSRYSIIHLAAHGISDETMPMRSAIVLGPGEKEDGFLQMREILGLELDADLVVLSGCGTGRGKLQKGEGVLGLTRAFLAAGTRSLVVSLWNVDDRSTSFLMEAFYGNLKEGQGKAEALRRAKVSLMEMEDGRYAHPYYWAPFVLIGDPK